MRCVKCGKIMSETLSQCSCGRDMKDIKMIVGSFPEPNKDFNWFSQSENLSAAPSNMGLGGIGDISDLFNKSEPENSFLQPENAEFDENEMNISLGEIGGNVKEKDLEDALKNLKF